MQIKSFPRIQPLYLVKGIAVGKVSEYGNTLEISEDWDLRVYGKMLKSYVVDRVYPIGSIYMSVSSTSPATLFGGTWTQLKDRFLLGAGDTYSNGNTGGSSTVTLTTAQMPSHSHGSGASGYYFSTAKPLSTDSVGRRKMASGTAAYATTASSSADDLGERSATGTAGSGSAHNNMPPYIVKYCWERIA